MKNILFGLMAVTSVAFAQQPNLGADTSTAPAGTVFQTGQKGEIAVHGKLQANPEILKYVVYASTDGTYTGDSSQETWTWPIYTLSVNKGELEGGMDAYRPAPNKVYVKKVNKTNDGTVDLTTEKVYYKINIDPAVNAFLSPNLALFKGFDTSGNKPSNYGKYVHYVTIFTFLSKSTIDEIADLIGATFTARPTSDMTQVLYFDVAGKGYYGGSLGIGIENDQSFAVFQGGSQYVNLISSDLAQKVDEYFATPRSGYSNFSISVKVQ